MKTWTCHVCRRYHTSGLDFAVDESVAEHKRACWDQRTVMMCGRCGKVADAEWIAKGNVSACGGWIGWLTTHDWIKISKITEGKMETKKEKSLEERLLDEYGELVRKLFLLQGNLLYVSNATIMLDGGAMAILSSLKMYVAKLENEKAAKAERERLKGIVREVLAERRDGTFDPTGTIPGETKI